MRRSHGRTPRSLRRHYPHQVQGVVPLPDLSAIRLPRSIYFQNKTGSLQVNAMKNCSGVCTKRLFNYDALLPAVSRYCDATPCFMLVWKIAIHAPFFCFHTEPAL
jgi:hypothetical protein